MYCGIFAVVDSLCAMDADETAETLLNIAGHEVRPALVNQVVVKMDMQEVGP
jgi:hypothetical protein